MNPRYPFVAERAHHRCEYCHDLTAEWVQLFNPRTERWDNHFRVDPITGEIHGTTPTGRATAASLDFNQPSQLEARQLWTRLRMFP